MLNKILLVDDETDLTATLADLINSYFKIECFQAENGISALKVLNSHHNEIALVICDISMPKMNGIELYKQSLHKFGYLPFVMLTAHAESQYTTEALRLGALDYFIKPVDVKLFNEQLPVWLEIGKRQQQLYKTDSGKGSKMELLLRLRNSSLKKSS